MTGDRIDPATVDESPPDTPSNDADADENYGIDPDMFPPGRPPWTVQQVADHWNLNPSSVSAKCNDGADPGIDAYWHGRGWMIGRRAIADYLRETTRRKRAKPHAAVLTDAS